MNPNLLDDDVQEYIIAHEKDNVHDVALKGSPFAQVTTQELVQQIQGRQICKKKVPFFVKRNVLYPPKSNLEQSSSQSTAEYKRQLINKPIQSIIDITGGFGVDLFFLSEESQHSVYCDTNEALASLALNNFYQLGRNIEVHHGDGINYLQHDKQYWDIIMVDPSRRTAKGKVILLELSSPNIINNMDWLLERCQSVLVKLSPMIDLTYLQRALSNIYEIHVLSVKNDLKEIIVLARKDSQVTKPKLVASDINSSGQCTSVAAHVAGTIDYITDKEIETQNYLYEPYSVLLKAQMQDQVAKENTLLKLDTHSQLFFSQKLMTPKLFKRFEIIDFPRKLNKQLGQQLGGKLNVVCRNFPMKPEEVLNKIKAKQGGDLTLFCSRKKKQSIFIVGRLI